MSELPTPPQRYTDFVKRYPKLGQAWEHIAEASKEGPLDHKTVRLLKLGIAIGAQREGAVHASVRKALAQGATPAELEQIVAVAAGTIGMPATVAVYSWIQDEIDGKPGPKGKVGLRK